MCQMKVVLDADGRQETIMDHVTLLRKTPAGIEVSALFEEPKTVNAAQVERIDFLAGIVTLVAETSVAR